MVTFNYRLGVFGDIYNHAVMDRKGDLTIVLYSRISEHQSLPHDEQRDLQLWACGPDGGPAVGDGEHPAVWRRPGEDHTDGPGVGTVYCISSLLHGDKVTQGACYICCSNHINYSRDYSYPGLLVTPQCTMSVSPGCGCGQCGVPGAQPDDPPVPLPAGDPHVGLHVLLLGPGGQPRGERRQAGQGAGLPSSRRPAHSPRQHHRMPQVFKERWGTESQF